TSLIWARDHSDGAWQPAGRDLWDSFFDVKIAEAVPDIATRLGELGSIDSAMQSMIAYSALPVGQGERPFGDTAIWSMFDDAGELGRVLAGDEAEFFDKHVRFDIDFGLGGVQISKDVKQYIADLVVQYAGALALYDVEQERDEQGEIEIET